MDNSVQGKSIVRLGMALALFSGFAWSIDAMTLDKGVSESPFCDSAFWLLAPLFAAGLHDLCCAVYCMAYNFHKGRQKDILRAFCSKQGSRCILGALFGAPLGMGGFLLALSMAGAAYTLPITSTFPAVAAVLAMVFLKEKISLKAWIGLVFCVAGAVIIGYVPPDGSVGNYFYLGIAFAFLSSFGWASEGVLETSAMDFFEPTVVLNVFYITSSILYLVFIVPIVCWWTMHSGTDPLLFFEALPSSKGIVFIPIAALVGFTAYACWYTSMKIIGVSRGMALSITYSLWGVLLSAVFSDLTITLSLVVGVVVIFAGVLCIIFESKDSAVDS